MSILRSSRFNIATMLSSTALFAATFAAAQPPPPTYYDLEVCFDGGDERCDIDINDDGWQSETYENSFIQGTWVTLEQRTVCPTIWEFSEWYCDDSDTNYIIQLGGSQGAEFPISGDTSVVARFVERTGTLTVYVQDTTEDLHPHPGGLLGGSVGHSWWKLQGNCVPTELAGYLSTEWGFHPVDFNDTWGNCGLSKCLYTTEGHLQDDTGYDENAITRTYEIEQSDLLDALEYTKWIDENAPDYDPESYNCTCALIHVAAAAGVSLPSAWGECNHWFVGFAGNCPGALGNNLNEE